MQLDVQVLHERARSHLLESAELKQQVIQECLDSIIAAAQLIGGAFRDGGKLLLCGNGGSAADCQHMAGELVNWLTKDFPRPGLPALALTTDSSIMSAIANDTSFESVFERQVQALGKPGDVLFGISTSGNSSNIVLAVKAAKLAKIDTIVLTGSGGCLAAMADVAIVVPSRNTQYTQEAHMAIEHIICGLVESYLFGER